MSDESSPSRPVEVLGPSLDLVRSDYVLVQAWKKTAAYIRAHNWFADTLALDAAAVDLPRFLDGLRTELERIESWESKPLRAVPAPKSQAWSVNRETQAWAPASRRIRDAKLRPLAHVDLSEQVISTAFLLCLADRVEGLQGDPEAKLTAQLGLPGAVSYGNRLSCGITDGRLRHRWGSTRLYRAYFIDYRNFLARPEVIAQKHAGEVCVIVQSDLRQFYDRVSPSAMGAALDGIQLEGDDPNFFAGLKRVLNWQWHSQDRVFIREYTRANDIPQFADRVVLPQGLVASGFFANVALLKFDEVLKRAFNSQIAEHVVLLDACRYVDDLRLVLTVPPRTDLRGLQKEVVSWLQGVLNISATGLRIADEGKTTLGYFRGEEHPVAQHSSRMERIQRAISGGFDALEGVEILASIDGLLRAQDRFSKSRTATDGWSLSPVPDVKDETVARFAAGRFRSTYRSMRPLLEEGTAIFDPADLASATPSGYRSGRMRRSDLDEDAKTFALGLIENWVHDPSNVRLLRIGLDLWPDAEVLARVLDLLRQYTMPGGRRKAPRLVAWYCMAELFRAAATETGFTDSPEKLPAGIDLRKYREVLAKEAAVLMVLPTSAVPWYVRQQVLLFCAAYSPVSSTVFRSGHNPETKRYRQLLLFMMRSQVTLSEAEKAMLAMLVRRAFRGRESTLELIGGQLSTRMVQHIAESDPAFAHEIALAQPSMGAALPSQLRYELGLVQPDVELPGRSMVEVVRDSPSQLRTERALLRFSELWLEKEAHQQLPETVSPPDVRLSFGSSGELAQIDVVSPRFGRERTLYAAPSWCPFEDRWRFKLGYLLRYMLTGSIDFSEAVKPPSWKEGLPIYRRVSGHWHRRKYALFNGHEAFGNRALPVSDWFERFLAALLCWPGTPPSDATKHVSAGILDTLAEVVRRSKLLNELRGRASRVEVVPIATPWPSRVPANRPLRIAVVQTVIPAATAFTKEDISLDRPEIRIRHRNHLAAALAALRRLLDLRATHKGTAGQVDLVVLPELAVHPDDVATHLMPFVRSHRTIVLAGLTYHRLSPGGPLANTALWLVPTWHATGGLQIIQREQGKFHLAEQEKALNIPTPVIQGTRPCQWVLDYPWDVNGGSPVRLTAAVCYDATDLELAADMRDRSDVFVVPALNRDVNTFDQMAMALHYHMYQYVVVANNGSFGGSNSYAPFREAYVRQVFHLHGQPQATIAFLEIDDIPGLLARGTVGTAAEAPIPSARQSWKYPPAGWIPRKD